MRNIRNGSTLEASDAALIERRGAFSRKPGEARIALILMVSCSLVFSSCGQNGPAATKPKPVTIEPIEGTDLNRIVLTEKAAKRIGIQTVPVKTEKVERKRRVGGEVMALRTAQVKTSQVKSSAPASSGVRVRVALTRSDLQQVNRNQPARILSLARDDDDKNAPSAQLDGVPDDGDADEVALQYVVKGAKNSLVPGQRVFVELPLGSQVERSVIPYAAVVYDVKGGSWVYTQSAPLSFVRHSVRVDYIDDDEAVLSEGPPAGVAVVTVGVAELFGSEFGIGK